LRPPSGYRLGWACGAVLAVSPCAPQVVRGEEVTKSFGVTGRPNVRVETNDGSVRVTSGDAKQVEFRVEYQGYELAKNLRVDARQDGNKVELIARATGHWGMNFGWGHNRRLHIEVRMPQDRKSTRLNSSHVASSYAVLCLKKKISVATPGRRSPTTVIQAIH